MIWQCLDIIYLALSPILISYNISTSYIDPNCQQWIPDDCLNQFCKKGTNIRPNLDGSSSCVDIFPFIWVDKYYCLDEYSHGVYLVYDISFGVPDIIQCMYCTLWYPVYYHVAEAMLSSTKLKLGHCLIFQSALTSDEGYHG